MKVITAIGTPYLNERMAMIDNIEVICKDILYQEGIIEILEENKEINTLVVSDILPSESNFEELINKVKIINKDIEIIVFLEKRDSNLEAFLNSKQIYKIYELSENDINIYLKSLQNVDDKLVNEISDFKNMLLNQNKTINEIKKKRKEDSYKIKTNSKLFNIKNKIKRNELQMSRKKNFKIRETKVIVISGTCGVGKTMISILLSQYISKQNKKVLLIDFDIFNTSIKTILGIKEYKNKDGQFDEIDRKINEFSPNLHVLGFGQNTDERTIDTYKIKSILEHLKKLYEFIIIDTSSQISINYVRMVLSSGDKIIFLVEPNISEIKKARGILEFFINDFNIQISKIKILFNKTNKYQIANSILEEIFSNFEIVGNIEYDEKYSLFINKNFNVFYDDKYKNIYEKL